MKAKRTFCLSHGLAPAAPSIRPVAERLFFRRGGISAAVLARRACAGLGLLVLGACSLPEAQPDLTRYFLLTSPAQTTATVEESAKRVFVRSVLVPEFLRGKLMQVRLAENEVRFVDVARWAEPLEPGLARVLRDNLATQVGVQVVARGGDPRDFEVVVQLRHCEGVLPAGVARLAARIEIFSAGVEPKLVAQDEFTAEIAGWDGRDYGELAGKLSEAGAVLSQRVAALLPGKP